MKLVADMHCHTVASGHAYSTIQEMVQAAAKRGLELIAITDHGGEIPDAAHVWHFVNLRVVPEVIDGVRVLKGVEANIVKNGKIDMPEEVLGKLDIVIASFHHPSYESGTVGENTRAMVNALKNPFIDILGHPDNPGFPVDIEEVVLAAKEYGKIIEMNNKSRMVRCGCEENALMFARKAGEHGVKISCGSDAHISFEVGDFDVVRSIIDEVNIPEELILNTSKVKILEYIKTRKRE